MAIILVIDDDEQILILAERILERACYTTLLARSGSAGLELAQTHQPTVIITDDQMPEINGAQVILHLRASPHTAHIPIILSSAVYDLHATISARSLGADAALPKPYRPNDLLEAIRAYLG